MFKKNASFRVVRYREIQFATVSRCEIRWSVKWLLACSRLQDSGESVNWEKEREKKGKGLGRGTATAPIFPDPARLIFAFPF